MNRVNKIALKYLERRKNEREEYERRQQEQQQKNALANAQAQEAQKKQYLHEASKKYRPFFRPLLGKFPYLDTVCMRCDAVDTNNGVDRVWLQIPLKAQSIIPSDTVLVQMIVELLSAECEQWLQELECKAYQLQMFCTSPETIIRHNQIVDDNICYFMNYYVQEVKTNGFKADIIIDATLNNTLMQSYYL